MMSPQLVDDLQSDQEERAKEAKEVFRSAAGAAAASDSWSVVGGFASPIDSAAASAAHYADLVVTGGPAAGDEGPRVIAPENLVVECGRPLLFNPEAANGGTIGERVIIAWSESREAARATFDSLPFLLSANTVTIVTVADEDPYGTPPRERIAATLKSHGVKTLVDVVPPKKGQSTSATLFDYASRKGADLLVAGAYSHSRWREGLFGGMTKSIFEAAPLPVLLSH
jgi:nucleotide-binding universal stress UspA family protein